MLDNQVTVTVATEERQLRLSRYANINNTSQGRSCVTAEGRSELSTDAKVKKDGSHHSSAMLHDQGNFIDTDGNRYDSEAKVSMAIETPADGYNEAHVIAMLVGLYNFYTTADADGVTPLQRAIRNNEK